MDTQTTELTPFEGDEGQPKLPTEQAQPPAKTEEVAVADFEDERFLARRGPFGIRLAEEDVAEAVARVERRVAFMKQSKLALLRLTDPGDWIDIKGTPYLQASGCRKLMRAFGISKSKDWKYEPSLTEAVRAMRNNEHVFFVVSGTAVCEMTNDENWFIGGRSSDDEFFTTKWTADGRKVTKPASELDVLDVLKSAVTNWERRAIAGLVGLDNLSWEDLAPRGIKPKAKVDFQDRRKAAERAQPPRVATPPAESQLGPSQKLTAEEMREAVITKLNDKPNPNKALQVLTRGKLTLVADVKNATDDQVQWLFEQVFSSANEQ